MKVPRLVMLGLLFIGAVPGAFCQATFLMQNIAPGLDAPIYDWAGGLLDGADWRAELYAGSSADSLTPVLGWNTKARESAPFFAPGYFFDGYIYVPGTPELGWAWLQMKVWNIQLGATYEDAVAQGAGGYGQSSLFYARGGGPAVLVPATSLLGLTSFSVLEPIPEPAVGWLAVAGLAVVALARRTVKGKTRSPP